MGMRRISYRETPCVKRISRVPPDFVLFFATMDIWTVEFLYYFNQGGIIVFNFKVTT